MTLWCTTRRPMSWVASSRSSPSSSLTPSSSPSSLTPLLPERMPSLLKQCLWVFVGSCHLHFSVPSENVIIAKQHLCLLSPVVFSSLSLLWRMSSSWNNACECLLSPVVFSSLSLPRRMSSSPKQCTCLWSPVVFSSLLLPRRMSSSPKQCLCVFYGVL